VKRDAKDMYLNRTPHNTLHSTATHWWCNSCDADGIPAGCIAALHIFLRDGPPVPQVPSSAPLIIPQQVLLLVRLAADGWGAGRGGPAVPAQQQRTAAFVRPTPDFHKRGSHQAAARTVVYLQPSLLSEYMNSCQHTRFMQHTCSDQLLFKITRAAHACWIQRHMASQPWPQSSARLIPAG
jgi:hypothetical protein